MVPWNRPNERSTSSPCPGRWAGRRSRRRCCSGGRSASVPTSTKRGSRAGRFDPRPAALSAAEGLNRLGLAVAASIRAIGPVLGLIRRFPCPGDKESVPVRPPGVGTRPDHGLRSRERGPQVGWSRLCAVAATSEAVLAGVAMKCSTLAGTATSGSGERGVADRERKGWAASSARRLRVHQPPDGRGVVRTAVRRRTGS